MDLEWDDEQLEEAGLDKKKVLSIARRLRKLSSEMSELGLSVYGMSGSGCLTHVSRSTHSQKDSYAEERDFGAIVAYVGSGFDGGDL